MEESKEHQRLFRIRKTTFKMLSDRGYVLSTESLNKTYEEFHDEFCSAEAQERQPGWTVRDRLMFQTSHKLTGEKILVFFEGKDKVKKPEIETMRAKMASQDISRAILIFRGELTSLGLKTIELLEVEGKFIEFFKENELLVNITEHKWVPKHVLLTDDEKLELLRRYKAKPSQLPRIQSTDPVARYLGLSVGQVVKIVRSSETAGRYVTYRRVIQGPRR